jgi:hypothetical protein
MFHYFKIPCFTCTFFTKFTYIEYIGPYFLSHVVSKVFASDLPECFVRHCIMRCVLWTARVFPYRFTISGQKTDACMHVEVSFILPRRSRLIVMQNNGAVASICEICLA